MGKEKLNILKLLIENQEEKYSIRKISKLRKINYKSAYQAVKKLENEGVICLEKTGNTSICSFNRHFNESVFEVEFIRRKELLKNPDFKVIYGRLQRINIAFIAVLFGSFARGTANSRSDIDLLIITEDIRPIEEVLSLSPLKIHITSVKLAEMKEMINSKSLSVGSEALKKNIILVGIEDYYRVINNE